MDKLFTENGKRTSIKGEVNQGNTISDNAGGTFGARALDLTAPILRNSEV